MQKIFKIGNILISEKKPPIVIAEIYQYNGNLDQAINIADAAIILVLK